MVDEPVQRRLSAILAADVVGYSRMVSLDEVGTVAALRKIWSEIFNPAVAARRGRVVKVMGDGALVEFSSVINAVDCAVAIQRDIGARNSGAAHPVAFRIGVNLGDVIVDGTDIFGDGVNVAARLESQAPPGGILVSDVVHSQVSGKMDVTFTDAGEIRLKNIDRPLRVWRWTEHEEDSLVASAKAAIERHGVLERPSIAVLPFTIIGSDPDQEFFADGLVEDIITTLSRLSGLSVIARHATFAYKGQTIDIRKVARELGVRYVLEGSVRKANRVRITTQLIDATTGIQIWANYFDRAVDDIFAVQDEITLTLATEMQVQLTEGEQARLRYTTTSNLEAWTLWIQGLNYFRGPVTRDNQFNARRCWEKALALDPKSASLNAMIAFLYFADARFGWSADREAALRKGEDHVERALAIEPGNPDAYRALAGILVIKRRFDEAIVAIRKAVELGPNVADVLNFASFVLASSGRPTEGIGLAEKAISLSPNHPAWYLGNVGNAYRLAGRHDEALSAFRALHARSPGYGLPDVIIILEQAGKHAEASRTALDLRTARPDFTVRSWERMQFRIDLEQVAAEAASLRAAGVPD